MVSAHVPGRGDAHPSPAAPARRPSSLMPLPAANIFRPLCNDTFSPSPSPKQACRRTGLPPGGPGTRPTHFLSLRKDACTHPVVLSAVTREDLHGLVPGMRGVGRLPLPKLGRAEAGSDGLSLPAQSLCLEAHG